MILVSLALVDELLYIELLHISISDDGDIDAVRFVSYALSTHVFSSAPGF